MIFDMGCMIVPPQRGTKAWYDMGGHDGHTFHPPTEEPEAMTTVDIKNATPAPLLVTDPKLTREDWLEILNAKLNAAMDVMGEVAPLYSVWKDGEQFLSISVDVDVHYAEFAYRAISNNFEHTGSQRFSINNDADRLALRLFVNFVFNNDGGGAVKYAIFDGTGIHKE